MKRYKLLKDLPIFKAGDEFFISKSGNLIAGTPENSKQVEVETRYGFPMKIDLMAYAKETLEKFPNILTDWFEEISEFKIPEEFKDGYYVLNPLFGENIGFIDTKREDFANNYTKLLQHDMSVGFAFKTKEEAEKHLAYLKAKQIIKQDTNGFEPDWKNEDQPKYYGFWDFENNEPNWEMLDITKVADIFFKSQQDIEASFKKHPEEWKAYLGV